MTQPKHARGFSIRILVPQGNPEGLRIVEKSNWTGVGLSCPRSEFVESKDRPEFAKAGVYVLWGPPQEADLPTIYVGEGDPSRPRLEQHFAKKDFWTSLTLFTSKDTNLNKAHVQYLESLLVALAQDAKRCHLDNGNVPQLPSLSEADTVELNAYLDEILLIAPLIGLGVFEKPNVTMPRRSHLFLKGKAVAAKGYEAPGGFTVLAGSTAVPNSVPSTHKYVVDLRNSLLSRGILDRNAKSLFFKEDFTFDSPSTAAGVVLGRSVNGRDEWKDASRRSLKQIQSSAVAES